ncbi:uncharacterized protein TRAVEDRAFT_50467 [Trametes versicolor FP-101664 SS1]|uniref:uncharacterized protein n=1 Tax=Trametes versicolor (strain FP-101664) TaxID=717944 RepID=UPI0004622518|nr:uncharacterized protein TRAVEDRAFT_50467 [Trametes versicolor FP-101664 SS1]EIW55977.1 hypothetical protein TRAVEDRAFT_50467 [Trametes versicolor FP-101664 SS1]
MAFNYGFDGLDFLPSLTFPGHQSLGNVNHSPFEDALATPRQSNGWTLSELIELNLAGPSQLPGDDQQYSLNGGFASNSFDPASDVCWGDVLSRHTTVDGTSDASAGGQGAQLEPPQSSSSAQEDLAFAYLSMPVPSSSLAQTCSEGALT